MTMRLSLIDQITELKEGASIRAVRRLDADEPYLKDHFPKFPCMPGVLMLEAMYQAGAWLLRKTDEFRRPVVMLKEARNVKYGSFVEPGQTLTVEVQLVKQVDEHTYKLKGQGHIEGVVSVSGVMVMDQFTIAERFPHRREQDSVPRRMYLEIFEKIYQPAALEVA